MRSVRTHACFRAQSRDVLYCTPMAQTELERFTRIMLDEFGRVHKRLDRHDDRFDNIESELRSIRAELKSIRNELDELTEKATVRRSTTLLSASRPWRSTSASTENSPPKPVFEPQAFPLPHRNSPPRAQAEKNAPSRVR